jgi:hypothetical protein
MTSPSDSFPDAKELSRLDDPIVRKRCVKLKRRSTFQLHLQGVMILCFLLGLMLLSRSQFGSRSRSGRHYPPAPALRPYGQAALGLGLAALACYLATQNYYLLDPLEHRLYHGFRFLWWRRRRILFRQAEILCLTTEARMFRSRYGSYWCYRLNVVGIGGSREPLSDWRRHALEECNAKARQLAAQLECPSEAAPPESIVAVEIKAGRPTLQFSPAPTARWFESARFGIYAILGMLLYLVILAIVVR